MYWEKFIFQSYSHNVYVKACITIQVLKPENDRGTRKSSEMQELEGFFVILSDLAIDSYLAKRKVRGVEKPVLPS